MMAKKGKKISGAVKLAVVLALLVIISLITNFYTDWLWFQSVNYQRAFITILTSKILLHVAVFIFAFLLFFLNLLVTSYTVRMQRLREHSEPSDIFYLFPESSNLKKFLTGANSKWILLIVSAFVAFILSSISSDNWIVVQQYIHRVSAEVVDPVFYKDLGFYFFNLEFYQMVYSLLMSSLIFVVVVTGIIYFINISASFFNAGWKNFSLAKAHMAILFALIFALKAWGFHLSTFKLLFSTNGIVFGATYTDINARLFAYKVLLVVSLVVALLIIVEIFIRKMQWVFIAIGTWVVLAVILQGVYPSIMQKFMVQPNQFNKERANIERAIQYTRQAYNLDMVDNKDFPITYDLNINDPIHETTVKNIRLWDWSPLKTTYQNLQQLRTYYVFEDVDVDRYTVDGQYRQVMLSVREMDQEALPSQAKDWINQKLMYTHGYGVIASPVNEVGTEGFPNFFMRDIPPRFTSDLVLNQPKIYFGERTNSYVIVNTKQEEFDYPQGELNVSTTYNARSGLSLNSWGKRLLFAWTLRDYKMLLSSDITNESQILLNRNIRERISMVAPYLIYDSDPYAVITPEGELYWMLDAYTTSDKYPYSQPYNALGDNYIRNSVKITCNAYNGEMIFYIADAKDPIIQSFSKIFPGLYKPLSDMPEGLKQHIRYPEGIFSIQADIYRTFHMTDPTAFYNKEDIWVVPREIVGSETTQVQPYYLLMQLPEETKPEYTLMLPYSPNMRLNMIAWMCARMDGDNYGKILVYNFPKQETIYGPEQIESRVNQDTVISQQLSLWNQQGSKVYRGNLLVIPMDTSLLYVEPLYLIAESSNLPELKRVIAAYGNKIVMEPTLDAALKAIFGNLDSTSIKPISTENDAGALSPNNISGQNSIEQLIQLAREYYDKADRSIKEGDWQAYGENLTNLNNVLLQLEQLSGLKPVQQAPGNQTESPDNLPQSQ